ncbi:MAG: hypothetical protein MMC23_007793 [Stictis urceolatum]|nr:hypothetical protein [Stictis urceolata]
MQGRFGTGFYGVHTAGHFVYAGDASGDLFASSGDSKFFLHHAQIDGTRWMWQNWNPEGRARVVGGNVVLGNLGSRKRTLEDVVRLLG